MVSNANGLDMKLSAHFDEREFRCKCYRKKHGPYCNGMPDDGMDPRLIELLENIRADLGGTPIRITSGYRCPKYNDLPKRKGGVGGARSSQHKLGTAADIVVRGQSVHEVAASAKKFLRGTGGIGIYPADGFVHVDVRRHKARW